ncbi:MFS transporter [Agrococcus versicolor]|uniref:MFS transporter n=1 Tax=Agrococcus versicolor TaxID=501482 RepID=A0ABN3AJF1_9MICO
MSVGHDDAVRLWTRARGAFVVSVLALMTCIAFESFAISTVLPTAMRDLAGSEWYSLAYAATITTALVGMVVGGNWADRSGTRRPLIVGGALFVFGLALCALAPSAATFIVGRLLQGIGGGIDSVVLYVLIAQRVPPGPRAKMFGLLTTAWLLPSMVGPVIAGILTQLADWRAVFGLVLVGAAAALAGLLLATRTGTPEQGGSTRTVLGRRGAFTTVAALLLLALHLGSQLPMPYVALAVATAVIALVIVVIIGRVLPPGTLRLRGAPQRLVALRAMLGATVTATDVYLTLYLQSERGFAPTTAGLVIAIGAVGWALGAWLQARVGESAHMQVRLIRIAAILVLVGPTSVLFLTLGHAPVAMTVAGCVVMGVGMGMAYPRISAATLTLARSDEQGAYSSALQAGEGMASAGMLAVVAAVLAATPPGQSFPIVYAALTITGCAAALVSVRLRR